MGGTSNLRTQLIHQASANSYGGSASGSINKRGESINGLLSMTLNSVIDKNKEMLRQAYENSRVNMKYNIAEAIQAKGTYGVANPTLSSINGGNSLNLAFTSQKSTRYQNPNNQTFYCGQSTVPEDQIELMAAGAYHISAAGSKQSNRSRGFNVLIDAFHNEVNVTQTNKALPPGGFFSPTNA